MAKIYDKKISKKTNWGGDESTGNLPVAGNRVQEFIKEQLNSKAGVFHYDTANNRYIVFADAENRDAYLEDTTKTDLIIGTFDAPFNYSAQITLSSPTYVAILSGNKNNYIDFTFDTMNKSGQSVGEDVICTYTIIKGGIKKTVTEKYRYGQAAHFNIDEYLSVGTNTIIVGIVGQTTLAATTIGITYQVVDLQLSDTYDISQSYNIVSNPVAAAAIPYAVSGYGTKIMEWYLDGVLLDYVKVEDEIVDVSTTRTKYIPLANLSQGIHSLQYRAYTMLDGERFYSNILYRDLIVVTGANNNPIIAVSATIPVGNNIITSGNLQLFGITQYIPYELNFAVYNPSSTASTDAVIAVDGKVEATIQTHNNEVTTYSLRPTDYGVKSLTITSGATVYTLGMNVSKSSTSLEPVTDGLQLDLMALGKSNNDVNREEWVYGLYSATFSGFNWNKTSGWNNNRLMITSGAYVDLNLAPLSPDPTATGKTLEFEFSTANVSDDNAVICDLRNTSGTGLLITASEVKLKSAGGAEVSTKFKSEENIRIAFVINKKSGVANKGLVFIYVNGELYGAVNYSSTDNFTSDKTLRIGNTNLADVQLKAIRLYNSALNSDQILNNYILYRDTTEELLSIYDKNAIYEEGTQNFSVDKLASQCPVFIFTGDIPSLENTTDKKKTIYVDVEYINMQDQSKSFTGKGIRLRPQGTSSMGYPKKNFRPYTGYGTMWDNMGKVIVDGLYSFAERAQPVNVWCLKADYAESSGTHNTGIARLWNQVMYDAQINGEYVLRTEAQKAAIAAGYPYDVRTTVDGFPCHVFYRLTADSELVYIGKYNFNNDKSTESVFGFRDIPGFDNSKVQCWELLNNGNHLALFQDMDNFDTEWDQAYEARYPDGSTDVADLRAFSEWVVSTKGDIEKFKAEKWEHLDVYKVAAYYIYLMRFAAVDQVIKNAMLMSEDGVKFFFINYDNDTIIGVRNDGLLIYNYDIDRQTVDTSFSALVYAYAGHESTLWNNLEADEEFMRIVSEVDNALYIAGLSYEKTIDMFDNKQSGKWCERVYNQDAQYKYIGPYTDSGINNLYMLQGARSAHRRWWLSHRFDLFDSKFVSGAYKAKSIEFKAANAPAGLEFSIVSGNNIFYGYGLNNEVVESGVRLDVGKSHTFTSHQVINVGDPVRVYSAVNVQELDIHNFIEYLSTLNIAEVFNTTVGTKFKKLVMGVDTATDNRRNTSLSDISGLLQAKRLEYLDISGYQNITNLDLSALAYFKVLKAYDSGLTSVTFASGASVSTLELPDTMKTINFDNLPNLGSGFNIKNYGRNVYSIFIRNCSRLNTKDFIFNWNANRLTEGASCSVTLEGISWAGVKADDLIALGSIKQEGGTLSLKGMISLVSVNQEQLNSIKSVFGNNCTIPGSELYIKAPDGVFVTGPTEILESSSAQYSASIFSENIGTVEYYIYNGSSEVSSYNGATIDKITGLLTTSITGDDRTITIRVKHIPTKGAIVRGEIQVKVNRFIFPTSVTITGQQLLNDTGNARYDLKINTSNVNGEYTTEWSLSGDAFEQGLVAIGAQYKSYCILNVLSTPSELTVFQLKATLKKGYNDQVTATTTYSIDLFIPGVIMTKKTNPKVLEACYNAGFCSNPNYMTEIEAMSVSDIGTAFNSVKMITFDELKYFTGLTSITHAFYYCSELQSVTFPKTLTSIGDSCFNYCRRLESIVIPEGVTSIGNNTFDYCEYLSSLVLPTTLKTIGSHLISSSTKITSLIIPEGLTSIGDFCFRGSNLISLSLPGTLKSIGKYALSECKNLATIILNEGITELGSYMFYNNISLESVSLPSTLTKIGHYAFSGCSHLSSIILPDKLKSIESYAFQNCINLPALVIPKGLTTIGSSAFVGCLKLVSMSLPSTLKTIGKRAFEGCNNLASIVVSSDNDYYSDIDGVLYDKTKTSLIHYPNAHGENYTIPKGVISIGDSAFYKCPDLLSVTIPEEVTDIKSAAFYGCIGLTSIRIPEGVTEIKSDTFTGCKSLTSITLPSTLISIGNSAFSNCTSLVSIDIPNGVKSFDTKAFYSCSKLESISMPDSLTSIGSCTFEDCISLTSIVIPKSIVYIGNSAFYRCLSLSSIMCSIPKSLDVINLFGNSEISYTGRNTYDQGTNILYVPAGATGYDTGVWLDPLCNSEKCGFTISYTL